MYKYKNYDKIKREGKGVDMAKNVVVKAEKVYGRKKKYSSIKLILSISILVLALVFIVLGVIYKGGKFTITLDKRLSSESGIVIYEDSEIKESKRKLSGLPIFLSYQRVQPIMPLFLTIVIFF